MPVTRSQTRSGRVSPREAPKLYKKRRQRKLVPSPSASRSRSVSRSRSPSESRRDTTELWTAPALAEAAKKTKNSHQYNLLNMLSFFNTNMPEVLSGEIDTYDEGWFSDMYEQALGDSSISSPQMSRSSHRRPQSWSSADIKRSKLLAKMTRTQEREKFMQIEAVINMRSESIGQVTLERVTDNAYVFKDDVSTIQAGRCVKIAVACDFGNQEQELNVRDLLVEHAESSRIALAAPFRLQDPTKKEDNKTKSKLLRKQHHPLGTLAEYIRTIPVDDIAKREQVFNTLFQDMHQALKELHGAKIVHGDIRPENIMVGDKGRKFFLDNFQGAFIDGKQAAAAIKRQDDLFSSAALDEATSSTVPSHLDDYESVLLVMDWVAEETHYWKNMPKKERTRAKRGFAGVGGSQSQRVWQEIRYARENNKPHPNVLTQLRF